MHAARLAHALLGLMRDGSGPRGGLRIRSVPVERPVLAAACAAAPAQAGESTFRRWSISARRTFNPTGFCMARRGSHARAGPCVLGPADSALRTRPSGLGPADSGERGFDVGRCLLPASRSRRNSARLRAESLRSKRMVILRRPRLCAQAVPGGCPCARHRSPGDGLWRRRRGQRFDIAAAHGLIPVRRLALPCHDHRYDVSS